jgi:hypothetical protein
MTETISLFLYVAGLYFSFLYLKHRRIRHLAIAQGLWILLIGFRMSYLLVVQVSAVLLPIMAFYPLLLAVWRSGGTQVHRFRPVRLAFVHLLTSIAMMLLLHGAYKQVNGWLCGREPGYLYATGFHLLAFWAPILTPADASDERLARIIEQGDELMILKLPEFAFSESEVDTLIGKARKHKALILDLRENPGGSVETLKYLVGSMFENEVKICDRVGRKEGIQAGRGQAAAQCFHGKTCRAS